MLSESDASRPWRVVDAAKAIDAGEISCLELTESILGRAQRENRLFNCFIEIEEEVAIETANARDREIASGRNGGPLFGVPFGYKDVFVRNGTAPSAGARDVRFRFRAGSSTVLEHLDHAGAVPIGRLNMDQFGYAATGTNPDFGDARNPWSPARAAGGSSSGAAVAVAAGVLPYAIGTDTGGSVRIPSSYCGVVGLKPTFGRISKRGAMPLSYSQDTVGIIARTANDVASVLGTIAGHDPLDAGSASCTVPDFVSKLTNRKRRLDGVRIGKDDRCYETSAPTLETALEEMSKLGAEIVTVDLSRLDSYDVAAQVLTWSEVAALHEKTFLEEPDAYAPSTRVRIETALRSRGVDYVNARRFQGRALEEFLHRTLRDVDLVATPTTIGPPPLIKTIGSPDSKAALVASTAALRLNRPFSFLGVPSLSLPVGPDEYGMPTGLQLVAGPWCELDLLHCGATYQSVTDWHSRVPNAPPPAGSMTG